ncbi:MAG: UDP-N-acetylmuramoyl-L-alanine--D-glutamate ligase [Armatimonadota bacterium]|nr:UDP-N-acetylmuramoyl-L-alanine--D-glutamate ligase [Armatimonadota bacterium]MDR7436810.1 UDP-N-acetylmuramoyl-L-alanine--D-glutamate ligase [Armatimonadota bacterium]MDR7472757.1 UDP-N-acetylmuramoyl-L-alanine--D-glutamate ligase [Armatimonadota bacterium]MDR7507309.1 UDP-N-acetylmuramoyl-L-alanine--D-glutamate ligase [Armatimonadota bacterium]MDR7508813.1 UDP-N-acetylmuramoyl-L-alanine--D-glutamate ligase [Armatimonadota bacterium]
MEHARVDAVIRRLRGQAIHVVGPAGTEGAAVVDFLVGRGITTLTVHELRRPEEFEAEFARTHAWMEPEQRARAARRLQAYPIQWRWADRYLEGVEDADVVFVPQSWFRHPANAPLHRLRDRGALHSLTRLVFEICPCPVIGVTGTNGKYTVAHLVHQMLLASGLRAHVSGNDRTHVPAVYFLDAIRPEDWLVLELSNRQLVDLPYSPHIAVLTNLAPHHLDDHGSLEAYLEVKRTIVRHQGPGDLAVLNADNPYTAATAAACPQPYLFSRIRRLGAGAWVDGADFVIRHDRAEQRVPRRALRLPGTHQVENALAACLAASLAGATAEAMARVLEEFTGLPYRFRLAGDVDGVRYYEDSLATNPAAAAAAIRSMDRPFALIAGGIRPGATPDQFAPMAQALRDSPVKVVVLLGAAAPVLAQALRGLPVRLAATLEEAVEAAAAAVGPGEAVVLSPGCESFDQFTDYRERGDRFLALVRRRAGGGPSGGRP